MGQISQLGLLEAVQVHIDAGHDGLEGRLVRVSDLEQEGSKEGEEDPVE